MDNPTIRREGKREPDNNMGEKKRVPDTNRGKGKVEPNTKPWEGNPKTTITLTQEGRWEAQTETKGSIPNTRNVLT